MKACPFCAEDVQDAAVVCKHCGRNLTALAPAGDIETPRRSKVFLLSILVSLVLVLIVAVKLRADAAAEARAQEVAAQS